MNESHSKLLSDLEIDEYGVVSQLRGGREFTSRMTVLGFTIGTKVTVLQNYARGPVIVAIRDTRIALGRGEALKVLVEVKCDDE